MSPVPRVLIIEDDRQIVQALSIRLRAVGYEIVAVYDGAAGIAMAVEGNPDVIVLDIRMPGMDGLAALTKLRELNSTCHIPVIIHSANVTNKTRTAAFELGSEYVLQKPCESNTFVRAIQAVVEKTSLQSK